MNTDELLRQLSEIKLEIQSMQSHLESIKNETPVELQDGFDIASQIIPELEMVIALQQDLLVYSKRKDANAVDYTKSELAKFK